jgi:hypothetical protein
VANAQKSVEEKYVSKETYNSDRDAQAAIDKAQDDRLDDLFARANGEGVSTEEMRQMSGGPIRWVSENEVQVIFAGEIVPMYRHVGVCLGMICDPWRTYPPVVQYYI